MMARRFFSIGFVVSLLGCGGNVTIGGGGNGGGGAGGSATTTGPSGPTGSTGTGTAPDDFTACNGPAQCTLVPAGCCPPCGFPEIEAYVAVHVDKGMDYIDSICPQPVPCDACVPGYNPHLFAYCDTAAGKCVAADARTHAVSACTSAEQCFLRGGTDCCESCSELDASELTALSSIAEPSLGELVCNPDTPCPPCAPLYPGGVETSCGSDGHCQVIVIDK
jgi:hypothetical protein